MEKYCIKLFMYKNFLHFLTKFTKLMERHKDSLLICSFVFINQEVTENTKLAWYFLVSTGKATNLPKNILLLECRPKFFSETSNFIHQNITKKPKSYTGLFLSLSLFFLKLVLSCLQVEWIFCPKNYWFSRMITVLQKTETLPIS